MQKTKEFDGLKFDVHKHAKTPNEKASVYKIIYYSITYVGNILQ